MSSAIGLEQIWGDGIKQAFCFVESFIGFQGHFPGNPVLPAIVQMQIGVLMAARIDGLLAVPGAINRAKFMRPIGPGQTIMVYCKRLGERKYAISIHSGELEASSFIIMLQGGYAQ